MFVSGDKVNLIDKSYSYKVAEKLEEHWSNGPNSYWIDDRNGWIVVESNLNLPTPQKPYSIPINDTIVRKGNIIVFINSKFLRFETCPTCGK